MRSREEIELACRIVREHYERVDKIRNSPIEPNQLILVPKSVRQAESVLAQEYLSLLPAAAPPELPEDMFGRQFSTPFRNIAGWVGDSNNQIFAKCDTAQRTNCIVYALNAAYPAKEGKS
jgi:hypothetical protein